MMRYRPEIDGLRAVAVIPVVLFHAGIHSFGGGFVGVDVFFVISGYLITRIISSDLEAGTFSIIDFYERRARRILPALFVLMVACIPFAQLWMMPRDLKAFAESVVAATTFWSNILFWRQSGYFDTAAELKPLLHTWSLAVEEQYYIFFPLLLRFTARFGKRKLLGALVILLACSFLLASWSSTRYPAAAFFLLPTRGWELLVGAIAALAPLDAWVHNAPRRLANVLSLIGLSLILVAIMSFDSSTPFPGEYALLPTLGAVCVILFGYRGTIAARFLSNRILVRLGLASYSIYLWHQPILAFARYRSESEPSLLLLACCCAASVPIGFFSWRFIETPFRRKTERRPIRLFVMSGAAAILLAIWGLNTGIGAQPILKLERAAQEDQFVLPAKRAEVVLWGDSFAESIAESIGRALNAEKFSLRTYTMASCPSLLNVLRNERGRLGSVFSQNCAAHNDRTLQKILSIEPDFVIITSAYQRYLTERNREGAPILLSRASVEIPPDVFLPLEIASLSNILLQKNITPVIITPHPMVEDYERKLRAKVKFGSEGGIVTGLEQAIRSTDIILAQMRDFGDRVLTVRGYDVFCGSARDECSAFTSKGSSFLYYDGAHLSSLGAEILSNEVVRLLAAASGIDTSYKTPRGAAHVLSQPAQSSQQ